MTNENTQITVDPIFVLYTACDINQCIDINIVDVKKRCIFGSNIITEIE